MTGFFLGSGTGNYIDLKVLNLNSGFAEEINIDMSSAYGGCLTVKGCTLNIFSMNSPFWAD